MSERKNKLVVLIDSEASTSKWPFKYGGRLVSLIAALQEVLDDIPLEYRDEADVAIGVESGYESSNWPTVTISYWRPETDDEMADRMTKERSRENLDRAKELNEVRRLMAKYGGAL